MRCPKAEECGLSGDMVPGWGSSSPSLILVGEAPGKVEEKQKRPFVGPAGEVLRSILKFVGVPVEEVYMTNVVKCRPPENRDPTAGEIACCNSHLVEELSELEPGGPRAEQVTVTLGAVALKVLFPGHNVKRDRGRILTDNGITGLATIHPAATLYPKGDTILPYIINDLTKVWRFVNNELADPHLSDPDTSVFIADKDHLMDALITRMAKLEEGTVVAYDWETTGLSTRRDVGLCLSLSWAPGTGVAIPMKQLRKHRDDLAEVMNRFQLVGYNAAMFDALWNRLYGLPDKVWRDVQLVHALLDERPQQRSLENLTVSLLDAPPYETQMLAQHDCKEKSEMKEKVPMEQILEYGAKDADWTLRLHLFLDRELSKDPALVFLYDKLVGPAAEAFADIQATGVWVDREKLVEQTEHYRTESERIEGKLQELVEREDFNPRSHPQVHTHLWDTLGLEEPNMYGRRPRSADAGTLEALQDVYPDEPFVKALVEYRGAYTMYSRYLRGMGDWIEEDGRIRTSYHLDRTETGRLSTTDPPLHQIPRQSDVRGIFAAPPGKVLVQADYSQAEIRMAAHIAQDRKLTALLKTGMDFHSMMASQAFKVPLEEVTPEQRQAAKGVSFGLLYLMGERKLASQTGLPQQEAVRFVRDYKAQMPDVWQWVDKIRRSLREDQVVVSPFGRRRRFPLVTQQNFGDLLREAVNCPIQSGASDLTLTAVVKAYLYFKQHYPEVKIVLMVHDSIVVECPAEIGLQVARVLKTIMEDVPLETDVPFPTEVKIGTRWGEGEVVA